jgi:hypothetical protein
LLTRSPLHTSWPSPPSSSDSSGRKASIWSSSFSPPNPSQALKDGTVDFFGGSPFTGLRAFPGWRGGTLLCALAQYNYWFLAVRADIKCERGDVSAVKDCA